MTTTTITTRHETAARFLAALAGSAERGELLELRYRLDDGQRMGQVFERPSRVRGLATRAIALGRRTDVYVGCAPRTRRHGGRDAVDRAFVLWADCDGEAAVAALADFEPAPSIVIASGTASNCHAYWPLTEPLERDDVERANRRLAHALGADLASADCARILRVPSTLSHKHRAADPRQSEPARRRPALLRRRRGRFAPGPADAPAAAEYADRPARRRSAAEDRARRLRAPPARRRGTAASQGVRAHSTTTDIQACTSTRLPERGWYCFGRCRRGGTIYDLAAPLYGYQARGDDFHRLRAELRRLFELEPV